MSRPRLGSALLVALPIAAASVVGIVSITGASPSPERAPTQADADQAELGANLFAQQCSSCHGLDGLGVEDRGPSLEHEGEAAADFVLRTGRMPLAAPNLQARRGPVRFTEEEILALVAHVGSLGDGPDIPDIDPETADIGNGGRIFRLNCAACHVASGAGAPIGGDRRAPSLEHSSAIEVAEAIRVGPGAMPVFSTLTDDEVNDVAAYVQELRDEDTTSAIRFGGAGPAAEGLAAWLIALVPLIALTRWIGRPKEGRDRPVRDGVTPGDDDPTTTETEPADVR
jgi:ubiquinol-cytochrome c reductase cytochrome c subunit